MQYMSEIYPRKNDKTMVYLKPIIKNPMICIGDYTYYHDALNDPKEFEYRNVLYQAPINNDKLIIGKFCSIAQGATFMLNCANHKMTRYSVYPFNLLFDLWGLPKEERKDTWENHGDIVVGNDVWIGYNAVIMSGVTIGDGSIIGANSLVTRNVPPYTIVGGVPAKEIRKRFDAETIIRLLSLKWWDWDKEKIRKHLPLILSGDKALFNEL